MNIRPVHDETTLPLPLLQHLPEFAPTQAQVHLLRDSVEGMDDMSDIACGTCGGRCGTPQACMLPEQREAEAKRLMRSAWKWLWLLSAAGFVLLVLGIGHA